MMNTISLTQDLRMPKTSTAFYWALGLHAAMFVWNPTVLNSHLGHQPPPMMRVEFKESMPLPPPPPAPPKVEKKQPVPKAKKSGLMMQHHAPMAIRPVKHFPKLVEKPAARSRPSAVKLPKFVPHAVDEDILTAKAPQEKIATTTALRPLRTPLAARRNSAPSPVEYARAMWPLSWKIVGPRLQAAERWWLSRSAKSAARSRR
jgi:hypothetical protein